MRKTGKARDLEMGHIHGPKENAFVRVAEENGLEPIRTVECFHILPLEKDLWQRCCMNLIIEDSL